MGVVREPQGVTAMLSPGTFGHGGVYGTQAWIDPAQGVVYLLLVQRADLPNSDASEVRKAFQQAAADAIENRPSAMKLTFDLGPLAWSVTGFLPTSWTGRVHGTGVPARA